MSDDLYNFDDETMGDEFDEFATVDPFEALTRREQDLFFKFLDLLPDGSLENAMDYFMSHPRKIRAVVDYIKAKKEMLENKDPKELQQLLEQENIVIPEGSEDDLYNV